MSNNDDKKIEKMLKEEAEFRRVKLEAMERNIEQRDWYNRCFGIFVFLVCVMMFLCCDQLFKIKQTLILIANKN